MSTRRTILLEFDEEHAESFDHLLELADHNRKSPSDTALTLIGMAMEIQELSVGDHLHMGDSILAVVGNEYCDSKRKPASAGRIPTA